MLKDKRRELIEYIKENKSYLARNSEALDIFRGNLLKYIDQILQSTLSSSYYETIKHRSLPINILQRFIDKVSVVYNNPPMRTSDDPKTQEFVDFYSDYLKMNQVGQESRSIFKSF